MTLITILALLEGLNIRLISSRKSAKLSIYNLIEILLLLSGSSIYYLRNRADYR